MYGLRRRILLASLCAAYSLATATADAAQESDPVQGDWQKIANIIVHRSLKLSPGERVIIQYLPGREPELLPALRKEIVTSGGIVSAELTWPTTDMKPYFDSLSTAQKATLARAITSSLHS